LGAVIPLPRPRQEWRVRSKGARSCLDTLDRDGAEPRRDDENWLKHTIAWRDDAGRVKAGDRPVHLNPLSNEVPAFPQRVY
jgi:hypothetical protein